MITAIGNNFGAGPITFKAYSSADILVLNGQVDVSASDPAFLAAKELEIYLPDQPMRKSAETAVYLVMRKQSSAPFATIVKARIRGGNTICIEKCRLYQYYGDFTLVFACAFVPRGEVGPFTFEGVTAVSASIEDGEAQVWKSNCVVREHWVSLFMDLNPLHGAEEDEPFSFEVAGLPNDIHAEIPIMCYGRANSTGTYVMLAEVTGPRFQVINPGYQELWPYGTKFLKAFFVRGDNN